MSITQRDRSGRARASYSDGELYALVAKVARRVNASQPTKVTQAQFDDARGLIEGEPDIPTARAICMRLGENGSSYPWRELLDLVCEDGRSLGQAHGRRRGEEQSVHLTERHLCFALNLIAQRLRQATLLPNDYASERQRVIGEEARRRDPHPTQPHLLAELLPTVGQVERIVRSLDAEGESSKSESDDEVDTSEGAEACDETGLATEESPRAGASAQAQGQADWDRALELAGLEPREELVRERSNGSIGSEAESRGRVVRAIAVFTREHGKWPRVRHLAIWAEKHDVALASQATLRHYEELITEAAQLLAEMGIDPPGPYGRETWLRKPGMIQVKEGGFPELEPRGLRGGRSKYTREDILDALDRFDLELSASEPRTLRRYQAFAKEHGLVAASRIQQEPEGFSGMLELARERRRMRRRREQ